MSWLRFVGVGHGMVAVCWGWARHARKPSQAKPTTKSVAEKRKNSLPGPFDDLFWTLTNWSPATASVAERPKPWNIAMKTKTNNDNDNDTTSSFFFPLSVFLCGYLSSLLTERSLATLSRAAFYNESNLRDQEKIRQPIFRNRSRDRSQQVHICSSSR